MLKLIEANSKYIDGYKEAYQEMINQIESGNLSSRNSFFMNPDEIDIIKRFKDNRDQSKLPSYYVPSYDFFAVDDDKLIGIVNIRVRLTDSLLNYGGHIGYGVNPKYWKLGYGKKMLKLALEQYQDLIEDDRILITCDDNNIGSAKIIEANGGILENIVENNIDGDKFLTRRYWIDKK